MSSNRPLGYLGDLDYSVVQQCMHCGMCLPSCPTYLETGKERNSPRGRISLMRAVADDELEVTRQFGEEMYYCLGCLACTTACPAGVDYADLFENARAEVEYQDVLFHPERRFWRWLTLKQLFRSQRKLRLVGRLLWFYQVTGLSAFIRKLGLLRLAPGNLGDLESSTPFIARYFSDHLIEKQEVPKGNNKPRYRVGLLTGCVQDLVFSGVNRDTADVLLENGCEVITPRSQGCCGSLHAHNGDLDLAAERARALLDQFDLSSLDAIITNAAGCGSHLKHLEKLLREDPAYVERAREWDRKTRDITEWLVEIEFRAPTNIPSAEVSATYHEACHLCHGQKISQQPREILSAIPGLELFELNEATTCCGSAGVYNITQPEQASKLQRAKMENIRATGASVVATANPGCHLQIENGFEATDRVSVAHPVSLLAAAYREERG